MSCTSLRASQEELGATAPMAVPCRKNLVRNSHQSGPRPRVGVSGGVIMACVLLRRKERLSDSRPLLSCSRSIGAAGRRPCLKEERGTMNDERKTGRIFLPFIIHHS